VHLQTCLITASKDISKLVRLWPLSSHNHGLQCICNLTPSWPPSTSPNSLDLRVEVYHQICTIVSSKFERSQSPSASPNSLDHSLQVYAQTRSIMASKLPRSWTWGVSLSSLNHGVVKQWTQATTLVSVRNTQVFRVGPDGSDGTLYPLMGKYTLPVAQVTSHVDYVPPLLCT